MNGALGELDLNKLHALATLLEKRSISGAARELGTPQPTLSHVLRQLREIFGDPLLVRAGNHMVLTQRAEALRVPLSLAIQSLKSLGETQEFNPRQARARFRLACTDFVSGLLLPDVMRRLRAESPGLGLVIENWGARRSDALRTDELDLGIGTHARSEGGIYQRKLFDERFVCVTDKSNSCAHNRLSPEGFAQLSHMQLSVKGAGGGAVDEALARLGLERRICLSVSHFWLAADFLRGTDLVLTVPERLYSLLCPRYPFLKRVRLPFSLPKFSLNLLWHERVHHDPAHAFLRQCIFDQSQRLRQVS